MPASTALHARLNQNGAFYGLYSLVEQVKPNAAPVSYAADRRGAVRSVVGRHPQPACACSNASCSFRPLLARAVRRP